jgi:hypothetical protein
MISPALQEHRLAIMTNWAFFASFGFCFVLSGFSVSDPVAGLVGFAAFIAGFIAHIIINRIFRVAFTSPQVALALTAFIIAVLAFIASALFDPAFSRTNIYVGFAGFGAIMVAFIVYVFINYGVRGSYAMMHSLHSRGRH